jgi:hypothetical protein
MGADVAAGPHCPLAGTWPGRRGVPRGAVSSGRRLNRGSWRRFLRGPWAAEAAFRFPRWLPDRAEALAVRRRRIWNSRPASRHPGPSAEASVPKMAGSSAEASVPPGVHGPKSWVRRFRSSRAETRSCPTVRSRSPGPAGGGARTEVPLSAGQVLNPKVRCPAWWFPTCPKAAWKPVGALRSMPLSHPLKGKPAASAWRRLRQPPCLSLPPGLPPEGDRPGFRSGCGWEGFPPLPGDRLGHTRKLSRKMGE